MNESNDHSDGLSRRDLIKGAAAAGLGASGFANLAAHGSEVAQDSASRNLIQRENARPGTRDWLLTRTHTVPGKVNGILPSGRSPAIEGLLLREQRAGRRDVADHGQHEPGVCVQPRDLSNRLLRRGWSSTCSTF